MASSLVKFASRIDGNGRGKLYWGRAGVDGLPFRGHTAPTFTEEEFDERVVRIADPHNGTFHTWVPEENQKYLDVMDKIMNDWARLVYQETWREKIKLNGRVQQGIVHYVVWAEFYLEDGGRAPAGYGQPVEFSHGQANGTQHHPHGAG